MDTNDDLIPTRQSLLSRLRDWEDSASWQVFFDTYWKLIYKTARSAGLEAVDAEEVVQETLISVSKAIREFQYDPQRGSFQAWLRNTTTWRIRDRLRRQRRDRAAPLATAEWTEVFLAKEVPDDAVGSNWDLDWEATLADAALERVKRKVAPKQFQIFDLTILKAWPIDKVARTFHVSAGYVYLVKHRVKACLRAELKKLRDHPCRSSAQA